MSPRQSSSNPYHLDSPIPRELPKINFAPYHSVMNDIDEWPTSDSHNSASPDLQDDVLNTSDTTNNFQSRTGSRTRKPPSWLCDYFIGFLASTSEPASFQTAVQDPLWRAAMIEELEAI